MGKGGRGFSELPRYTKEESAEQLAVVDQAMVQGVRHNAILRMMRERFGVGPSRVQKLEQRVRDRLAEEGRRNHATAKEVAVARAERALVQSETLFAQAAERRDHQAQARILRDKTRLLDHLAMLNGLAQVNVNETVNVNVSHALVGAIASLTPEQTAQMVARARERERMASAYEQEVLGVVDASKLPPHANGTAQ
jgi:hypothetical protein